MTDPIREPLSHVPLLTLTCFFEPREPLVARMQDRLGIPSSPKWIIERGPLDHDRPGFSGVRRGGAEPITATVWSPRTRPDLAAFHARSADGWSHFVRKLAQAGGPGSISMRSSLATERWGVQDIEYQKTGSYWPARSLRHLDEDKGREFLDQGDPFPFEAALNADPTKRIDTRANVLRFLRQFGIDLEQNDFWRSDQDAIYLREIRL